MEEGGGEGGVRNAREDMLALKPSLQPTHPVDTSASGNYPLHHAARHPAKEWCQAIVGVSVESKLSEKQVGLRFGRRPGATTMLAEQG